jgi:hypothetical protein
MTRTLPIRRLPAVVLLLLCAAPVGAEAQQYVCWPIVRGDTASGLALRLTGTPVTAYSEAFQISDPRRQGFVPKSQYSRLSTGWQACVARELVKSNLLASPLVPVPAPPPATPVYDVGFAMKFGAGVSLMLLMISAVASYAAGARPIPPLMQRAGEDFLTAFATPLIDPTSPVPPVTGRLRFIRRKKQLEICIAPNGGRRYPNLSDHKKNVVYDVQRVLGIMGAHRIVCDRVRAEGQWVVVSIRFKEPKQAGVN